jgi:hypothetical protein
MLHRVNSDALVGPVIFLTKLKPDRARKRNLSSNSLSARKLVFLSRSACPLHWF